MRVEQHHFSLDYGWKKSPGGKLDTEAHLVFVFGGAKLLSHQPMTRHVREMYPEALITGCSTAGEIEGLQVYDDSIAVTAVSFKETRVRGGRVNLYDKEDGYAAGERLADTIEHAGLRHAIVFADGLNVNGSELVAGLSQRLPASVTVSGGLAADGDRFEQTYVVWDGAAQSRVATIVGLYGDSLRIGCGSLGGWDSFGPERLITRSKANVLYELDSKSALELYTTYLGEHATGLPATGLLFPLSLRIEGSESRLVRTILSVNRDEGSLVFAGDVPEGSYAQLMKANFDRLIDGATGAASACMEAMGDSQPELALLISCVGRRMVLNQRIEEEVEGVADVVGPRAAFTGFYSYGEISPYARGARCELHNQTMTVTTFSEP